MADAARRLRRRCASFDRRQHAGAPRGYAMNMLADSGVPVMLTNRIYAAGQSVPYMSNPGAARFEAVPRKLWRLGAA